MILPSQLEQHELYTSSSSICGTTKTISALHHGEIIKTTTDSKPKRSSATVRFAEDKNVVHEIISLSDYTPEEVRACFFNRVEYNSFRRSSLITLNLNREGRLASNDPDRTMRGLECRLQPESRRELREHATVAVMNEQCEQNRLGYRDAQAIADIYHSVSWESQYLACTQGLADEQDAAAQDGSLLLFVPRSKPVSKQRNTVLSKIISIEKNEPNPAAAEEQESFAIAGLDFDSGIWGWSSTNDMASFNLNSFFNNLSVGIAVGAA